MQYNEILPIVLLIIITILKHLVNIWFKPSLHIASNINKVYIVTKENVSKSILIKSYFVWVRLILNIYWF